MKTSAEIIMGDHLLAIGAAHLIHKIATETYSVKNIRAWKERAQDLSKRMSDEVLGLEEGKNDGE